MQNSGTLNRPGTSVKTLTFADLTLIGTPVGWTNNISAGVDGIINANITVTSFSSTPDGAIAYYVPLPYLASDSFDISLMIDATNASAGGYGSAQADACIVHFGLANDVSSLGVLATNAATVIYEHGGATQPRAGAYQNGGGVVYSTGSASGRLTKGVMASPSGYIKSGSRVDCVDVGMVVINNAGQNAGLVSASASAPLYLVVCFGRVNTAGTSAYNIPFRFKYQISKRFAR